MLCSKFFSKNLLFGKFCLDSASAGMYCIGTYIGIEKPMFHSGLNTGRINQFRALLAHTGHTGRYNFFFFFEFL